MLHPYITASEPSLILYYLDLNSEALNTNRPVANLEKQGCKVYAIFYIAIVVLLKGARTPEVQTPPLTPTLN